MDHGTSMSDHEELDKRSEANKPDYQQTGLTRFSPVGKLVQRVGRRMDLVTRLLHEESSPNGLTAEQAGLPAGTLRKFGGVECAWCPPGQFMMGSPESEEGRGKDEVQHPVILTNGFWMSCCPVIQADYQAVVGSNPSRFVGIDCPAEQVSWEEAVEFCRKLTLKQREGGMLPERWEWRLPTEAEWEYAARAGTTGPRYGELNAIAWWDGNSRGQTHPVKQKAANAWGLYDMIGNVWEWCSDWSGEYPTWSVTDPKGPSSGSYHAYRGGSCEFTAGFSRSATRAWDHPDNWYLTIGFRPVLSSVG
jgi:formylglycine-generating enzyme required for sulfatase activity